MCSLYDIVYVMATLNQLKFTVSSIKNIPLTDMGKQTTFYDTELKGFAIRVGATSKTYIVYKRINRGAPKRVTLGKVNALTLEEARKLALKELSNLTHGVDQNAEHKKAKDIKKLEVQADSETIDWLLKEYLSEKIIDQKGGKDGTIRSVNDAFKFFNSRVITTLKRTDGKWQIQGEVQLEDWLIRPFRSITRDEVLSRFDLFSISKPIRIDSDNLQPMARTYQIAFKFLSSAYNFIITRDELDKQEDFRNPLDILKAHGRWKKANIRTRMVDFQKPEINHWWNSLLDYQNINPVASDYILFSLLQSGRSSEIATLTWNQIDFDLNQISYRATKNNLDYIFPISKMALEILERRKKECGESNFVFHYKDSKTGHIPSDAKAHFKNISESSDKLISHHDLRRTWGTAALHLDINERIINYCLKHTIQGVNAHYFMRNAPKIHKALQDVENFLIAQVATFETKQ